MLMRTSIYFAYRLFALLLTFGLASCQLFTDPEADDELPDNLAIEENYFTDEHKFLYLNVDNIAPFYSDDYLTADSISFNIVETWANGDTLRDKGEPTLFSYRNIYREKFDSIDFHPLVIVDLTLSQKVVDAERVACEKLLHVFGENNLYISFLKGEGIITPTQTLSKYILSNNFTAEEDKDKHLYKAMLAKLNELGNATYEVGKQRYKTLVVMSDGAVWGDERPYDEDHFDSQQAVIDYYAKPRRSNMLYFCYFPEDDMVDTNDNNLFQMFCQQSNGLYVDEFDLFAVVKDMAKKTVGDVHAMELALEFPDNRIFDGDPRVINISMYCDSSTVIAEGAVQIMVGSIFNPIIVNGKSATIIVLQGILLGLLILALAYLILQFIVPYISYILFTRKYVVEYSGQNTTANGKQVADTCYYCKAPFEEGDKVVAKCEHAMHLECWEENDYHCPEHGIHCKDGSHYYNRNNLFDTRNTTFYTGWVLLAIVAAILVWLSCGFPIDELVLRQIVRIYCYLNDLDIRSTDVASHLDKRLSNVYHIPIFTISLGFFLTLILGFKIVNHYTRNRRILEVLVRAVIAGIVSTFVYVLCGVLVIISDINLIGWLFEWIPWFLLMLGLGLVHTFRSRIHINLKWLLANVLLSFVLMFMWYLFVTIQDFDYRVTIVFIYVIACVGYAVGIAYVSPQSEHYFFKVEGAVKTMDIALYKWFRSSPHRVVTIGKSVDCSLQMSWDINSYIAPVQLQVTLRRKGIYITPLEDGVFDDKDVAIPPEKSVLMRHGSKFRIGKTIFTYIEKD